VPRISIITQVGESVALVRVSDETIYYRNDLRGGSSAWLVQQSKEERKAEERGIGVKDFELLRKFKANSEGE